MQLYAPAELEQFQQDLPYLTETKEWVNNFLAAPHPELGRPGPVCPFLPKALKLNTIQLAVIRTKHLSSQQIEDTVKHYRNVFLEQEPKTGELAYYKAIMLIFPDVTQAEAPQLIDGIQQKLKPLFVEEGLMIGEFHQHNNSPGLHNPNFRPLRSPIPMLAIRFMAESDLPFLDRMTDRPELRVQYLEAYLKRLGATMKDRKKVEAAREALALANTQLNQSGSEPIQLEAARPSRCPFARLASLPYFNWLTALRPSRL